MSGAGAPKADTADARGMRIAIIAGSWHENVMSGLVASAALQCELSGAEIDIVRVPGAFELPIVSAQFAKTHDAVIALGVIIKGGTPHFDYVCRAATDGLTRVALDSGTPIGFGLLTCDDEQQALDRAGLPDSKEDKGKEAALAAIETALLLRAAAN